MSQLPRVIVRQNNATVIRVPAAGPQGPAGADGSSEPIHKPRFKPTLSDGPTNTKNLSVTDFNDEDAVVISTSLNAELWRSNDANKATVSYDAVAYDEDVQLPNGKYFRETGVDITFTLKNDHAVPIKAGWFYISGIAMNPAALSIMQPGLNCRWATLAGGASRDAKWPLEAYSPFVMLRDDKYYIAVGLIHDQLGYNHEVRCTVINNTGIDPDSTQVKFDAGDAEVDSFSMMQPGETRTYRVFIRIMDRADGDAEQYGANGPGPYVHLLAPYKRFFSTYYGDVKYAGNTLLRLPILLVYLAQQVNVSDLNPRGYVNNGGKRVDTHGFVVWSDKTATFVSQGWKRSWIFDAPGKYRVNQHLNIPFPTFTGLQSLAGFVLPSLATAVTTIKGQGYEECGAWHGHSVYPQVFVTWDNNGVFTAGDGSVSNPNDFADPDTIEAFAEMDLAAAAGLDTIGLDASWFTPIADLYKWFQLLLSRYPTCRIGCHELMLGDLFHNLLPGFIIESSAGGNIREPHWVSDYINPGNIKILQMFFLGTGEITYSESIANAAAGGYTVGHFQSDASIAGIIAAERWLDMGLSTPLPGKGDPAEQDLAGAIVSKPSITDRNVIRPASSDVPALVLEQGSGPDQENGIVLSVRSSPDMDQQYEPFSVVDRRAVTGQYHTVVVGWLDLEDGHPLRFFEPSGSECVTVQSPPLDDSYDLWWPAVPGEVGQVLAYGSSGQMEWVEPASGGGDITQAIIKAPATAGRNKIEPLAFNQIALEIEQGNTVGSQQAGFAFFIVNMIPDITYQRYALAVLDDRAGARGRYFTQIDGDLEIRHQGRIGFGPSLSPTNRFVWVKGPASLGASYTLTLPPENPADGYVGCVLGLAVDDGTLGWLAHGDMAGLADDDHGLYVSRTPVAIGRNTVSWNSNFGSAFTIGIGTLAGAGDLTAFSVIGILDVTTNQIQTDNRVRITGHLELRNRSDIRFYELTASGTDAVTMRAPDTLGVGYTIILPPTEGASGNFLKNTGSGAWAWGTITLADLPSLNETIDDRVAALFVAGTNITLTYNDTANTLTIDAVVTYGESVNQVTQGNDPRVVKGVISATFDGGGVALVAGAKCRVKVPFKCVAGDWTILGNASGSAVVDVRSCDYSTYPTTSSIAGSEKPSLSAAQKNQDLTLSSWTTAIPAETIIEFVLDSVSGLTRIEVEVNVNKVL